ncbi:hypothetical protein ACFL2K_05390 [Candidatus Margulisiibacteriota bacterium]
MVNKMTINKDQILEEIKELTDPVKDEDVRQKIIDYVASLFDKLNAEQEYTVFGFNADDVRKKYVEIQVGRLALNDMDHLYAEFNADEVKKAGLRLLTEQECNDVLDNMFKHSDMANGVSWDNLQWAIEEVIGEDHD